MKQDDIRKKCLVTGDWSQSIRTPTPSTSLNGTVIALFSCRCDVRVLLLMIICKILLGILANSTDQDQTPKNAASDQGLHCLF